MYAVDTCFWWGDCILLRYMRLSAILLMLGKKKFKLDAHQDNDTKTIVKMKHCFLNDFRNVAVYAIDTNML